MHKKPIEDQAPGETSNLQNILELLSSQHKSIVIIIVANYVEPKQVPWADVRLPFVMDLQCAHIYCLQTFWYSYTSHINIIVLKHLYNSNILENFQMFARADESTLTNASRSRFISNLIQTVHSIKTFFINYWWRFSPSCFTTWQELFTLNCFM